LQYFWVITEAKSFGSEKTKNVKKSVCTHDVQSQFGQRTR